MRDPAQRDLQQPNFIRHCERSEAIQGGLRGPRLPRFARNDEEVLQMSRTLL